MQDGATPLIGLVAENNLDILKAVLEKKPDVNQTYEEKTPLMVACIYSNNEMAKLLLKHKADVDLVDDEQMTALMHASAAGAADLIKTLWKYKADPKVAQQSRTIQRTSMHCSRPPCSRWWLKHHHSTTKIPLSYHSWRMRRACEPSLLHMKRTSASS